MPHVHIASSRHILTATTKKKVSGSCVDIFTACTRLRVHMAMMERPTSDTNMQAILPPRGTCSSRIECDIAKAVLAVLSGDADVEEWKRKEACVHAARGRTGGAF